MDLQFKLDKNIELISELSKYVFNIHREKDPQVFGEYDYNQMFDLYKGLENRDSIQVVIVYDGNEPIGYSIFMEHNFPTPIFNEGLKSIYIDMMCIIPKYQRQGIGTKLFSYIKNYAKSKNINRIDLDVWTVNSNAINFYKHIGFQEDVLKMKLEF
jgi:ribosomal protein S18 acetylase RimI-like enzyme